MITIDWCRYCIQDSDTATTCFECIAGHDDITAPSKFLPRKDIISNGDTLRSYTDNQLSEFIPSKHAWNCPPDTQKRGGCHGVGCVDCWLRWLKANVDE